MKMMGSFKGKKQKDPNVMEVDVATSNQTRKPLMDKQKKLMAEG